MNDKDFFILAIKESPLDVNLHAVYADWLEEHADVDAGKQRLLVEHVDYQVKWLQSHAFLTTGQVRDCGEAIIQAVSEVEYDVLKALNE